MKIWEIKHNGYLQCQKRGRNMAVEALKRTLAYDGIPPNRQRWVNSVGIIKVTCDLNDVYTIEECKGE